MSPKLIDVVAVLVVIAVLVARLLVVPLGIAPWIAALASLLLVAQTLLVGVTLRRQTSCEAPQHPRRVAAHARGLILADLPESYQGQRPL